MKILIINGPNLNLLGTREPLIYGKDTLEDIIKFTNEKVGPKIQLEWFQSNVEGEIINKIHQLIKDNNFNGLIINPGGYSHTSVAIHDALKSCPKPRIEVHLSQIYQREEFRHNLLTAKACSAIMSGLGKHSYYIAVNSLLSF